MQKNYDLGTQGLHGVLLLMNYSSLYLYFGAYGIWVVFKNFPTALALGCSDFLASEHIGEGPGAGVRSGFQSGFQSGFRSGFGSGAGSGAGSAATNDVHTHSRPQVNDKKLCVLLLGTPAGIIGFTGL